MYFTPAEQKHRSVTKLVLGILGVALVSFVGTKLYPLIHGPVITTLSMQDGAKLSEPLIHISGKTKFTKDLVVNGASFKLNPDGAFDESFVLAPGYNIITMQGRDRFGTVRTKNYAVMLNEEENQTFTVNTVPLVVN